MEIECWNDVGDTVYGLLIGEIAACVHITAVSYNPLNKSIVCRSQSGMTIVQDEVIVERLRNTALEPN